MPPAIGPPIKKNANTNATSRRIMIGASQKEAYPDIIKLSAMALIASKITYSAIAQMNTQVKTLAGWQNSQTAQKISIMPYAKGQPQP